MSTVAPAAIEAADEPRGPAVDPLAGTHGFLWTFRFCVYGLLIMAVFLGGPIVRAAAVAAMVLSVFADRSGAIRHLLHLAWLPLVVLLTTAAGVPLGRWLTTWTSLPTPAALLVGVGAVVVGGLLGTALLGGAVTRRLRKHRYLYVLNRTGGCLLGVGEGALLVAALVWTFSVFGPAIYLHAEALATRQPQIAQALRHLDTIRVALRADPANAWLERVNPLPHIPAVVTVAALAEVSAEPGLFWQIVDEGRLQDLLKVPVIRKHYEAIKADPRVREALDSRNLRVLMTSPHLATALEDEELCRAIAERWPGLRARISDHAMVRARELASRLDPESKQQYERAVRRAEQFGVSVP